MENPAQTTETGMKIPLSIEDRIEQEVTAVSDVVKQHEEEAKSKGIPLKLTGARYRIYNTDRAK